MFPGGEVALPTGLAGRPTQRGLPIPVVNITDGVVDFTSVNASKGLELARQRRCALCGEPIGYWVAFLGGPLAAEHRSYSDPPMCVPCAEAALVLCPHMARQAPQRAARTKVEAVTPKDMTLAKPETWVLYITRGYTIEMRRHDATSGYPIYRPAAAKDQRRFEYDTAGRLEAP